MDCPGEGERSESRRGVGGSEPAPEEPRCTARRGRPPAQPAVGGAGRGPARLPHCAGRGWLARSPAGGGGAPVTAPSSAPAGCSGRSGSSSASCTRSSGGTPASIAARPPRGYLRGAAGREKSVRGAAGRGQPELSGPSAELAESPLPCPLCLDVEAGREESLERGGGAPPVGSQSLGDRQRLELGPGEQWAWGGHT